MAASGSKYPFEDCRWTIGWIVLGLGETSVVLFGCHDMLAGVAWVTWVDSTLSRLGLVLVVAIARWYPINPFYSLPMDGHGSLLTDEDQRQSE